MEGLILMGYHVENNSTVILAIFRCSWMISHLFDNQRVWSGFLHEDALPYVKQHNSTFKLTKRSLIMPKNTK